MVVTLGPTVFTIIEDVNEQCKTMRIDNYGYSYIIMIYLKRGQNIGIVENM